MFNIGDSFDQDTELAAFFPDWECISFYREQSWPRKPLQHILEAYLEMINEGTVETSSETERGLPERFFPWQFQQYTQRDIEKAVAALTRLLDAIECRLPLSTLPNGQFMDLPYSESVINEACVPNNSFIRSFLLALPVRRIQFRYIAPGIGIQSATEFIAQPFAKLLDNLSSRFDAKDSSDMPVCLFRGDGVNASPWIKPWFPDGNAQDIPSGLYTEWIHKWLADFGNQCRLLLPFGIGARGYARSSNGIQLGHHTSDRILEDVSSELYQAYYFSGFLPTQWRAVQLHKVLLNWAGRVEMGDWEVNKDGVAGGIENFTEADTPEHWKKYQVPLSW